jgi:hypothetical protein
MGFVSHELFGNQIPANLIFRSRCGPTAQFISAERPGFRTLDDRNTRIAV